MSVPSPMRIQIKKGRDSRPTLTCVRADGTRTWSRVHPFLPVHDLTHYAVETVCGFDQAFFGLVASGWDLEAFEDRDARARMPAQALWAEHIVNLLDLERGMQRRNDADEFNEALAASLEAHDVTPFRTLSERELAAIRAVWSELQGRWMALAPGETLELQVPAGPAGQ